MTISQFVTVEWAPASDPTDVAPTWVDITSVVQSVDTGGGRSGVFDLYGPRTATITARNGTKSPAVGPTWAIGGFYRWRQIRVLDTVNSIQVFTGYILTVVHDQTNSPFHGVVTIECTDKLGVFASGEFEPLDTSGNMVNGLSNVMTLQVAADFAASLAGLSGTATVDGGSTALFKLPDEPSGQVLSWLQEVLEGEVGGVQVAATGDVYVTGRWEPFNVALPGAGFTFSDTPGVDELPYLRENLTFASTDSDYYNRAVTKSAYWDATFTTQNIPSGYPAETLSRTDLPFAYQSWAEANAAHYARLYSQAVTYPRSLVVYVASAHAASSNLADLLQMTLIFGETFVAVKHTPAGDTQKTYNVTIENVHHTITAEVWKCELGFASLDRWITAYGDAGTIFELVQVDGDSAHGVDSDAIVAP